MLTDLFPWGDFFLTHLGGGGRARVGGEGEGAGGGTVFGEYLVESSSDVGVAVFPSKEK